MQKNDIVKVKIEDVGVGGEGIGKVEGYTLFIKDAIIGDVVEAKIMKAKKELWICETYEYSYTIRISRGKTGLPSGKKVRGMSDSRDEV